MATAQQNQSHFNFDIDSDWARIVLTWMTIWEVFVFHYYNSMLSKNSIWVDEHLKSPSICIPSSRPQILGIKARWMKKKIEISSLKFFVFVCMQGMEMGGVKMLLFVLVVIIFGFTLWAQIFPFMLSRRWWGWSLKLVLEKTSVAIMAFHFTFYYI